MKRIIAIILMVSMIFTTGGFSVLAESISDVIDKSESVGENPTELSHKYYDELLGEMAEETTTGDNTEGTPDEGSGVKEGSKANELTFDIENDESSDTTYAEEPEEDETTTYAEEPEEDETTTDAKEPEDDTTTDTKKQEDESNTIEESDDESVEQSSESSKDENEESSNKESNEETTTLVADEESLDLLETSESEAATNESINIAPTESQDNILPEAKVSTESDIIEESDLETISESENNMVATISDAELDDEQEEVATASEIYVEEEIATESELHKLMLMPLTLGGGT